MISDGIRDHLCKYWRLSREFYGRSDYALASFFAITLIEEIGKVVVHGNFRLTGHFDKKAFWSHPRKYTYAVAYALLVNSRVQRIYGEDEQRFANWFKTKELLKIRNRALYADRRGADLLAPATLIGVADAFLLVCIAGEILAEIQGVFTGTGPGSWQRIVSEVDEFRAQYEGTALQQ